MRLHLFWQVNGHNVVHACMQSNKVGFSLPSSLKQDTAILRRGIHFNNSLAAGLLTAETGSISTLESCTVSFGKVTEAGVSEVVRSLWIVTASVTRIGLTGFQSIVITPAIRADVVTKNVAAVIPVVGISIRVTVPVPVWTKPRTNKNTSMEAAAVESHLRVRISARERGHTEYQQSAQEQISNSSQQIFSFHDHASFYVEFLRTLI
jgi:hypothetical protein